MAVTSYGFETTADEVISALTPEIHGKNVLINGTTWNSLGSEAARVIAEHANLVIVGGRNPANLELTIENIKKETPAANLRPFIFDMSSLAGARKAAEEVNAMPEPIHVAILSASIMGAPFYKTSDGIEHHMAVNHFAPFLFTALIFPKIAAAGTSDNPARIINISSRGHHFAGLQDDVNFHDGTTYDKWKGYGQSKTANILFANEIARRAKESGVNVVSFAVHPGPIGGTNLGGYLTEEDWSNYKDSNGNWLQPMKTQNQGVAGYIVAAFDPRILPYSGGYIADADIREDLRADHARPQVRLPFNWRTSVPNVLKSSSVSLSSCVDLLAKSEGERLWELSETLTGQKFVI